MRTSAGPAVLVVMLVTAGCAGTPASAPDGERLRTSALAARASEFQCAHGRWPTDAAELEAFPLPERSRAQLHPGPAPVPWSLLRTARFEPQAGGSLLILASLPADRLVDGPASRPVDLRLLVATPGCWPPAGAPAR